MIHKWYHKKRYGIERSYQEGMDWLAPCDMVEDWGCALCYAKNFRNGAYLGIDGTPGKADKIADLSTYRSKTSGLFMRHILEHNLDWRVIMDNAIASFTQRMALVLFRPLADKDVVYQGKFPGHVDIDMCRVDFESKIAPLLYSSVSIPRDGGETDTVFFLAKP